MSEEDEYDEVDYDAKPPPKGPPVHIQTILDRDPRGYSRQDLEAIIQVYRERRHQFNLGPAPVVKATSAKQKEVLSLAGAIGKLDL